MVYEEVIFEISPLQPWRDVLIAYLSELPYESFLETKNGLKAYIHNKSFDKAALQEVLKDLNTQVNFHHKTLQQKNWNAAWESDFKPIRVGDHCGVRADFHQPIDVEYEIIITPKMSFGTGHHATTFGMMEQMLQLDFQGKRVLDMGCGTAVLAILAEKLGSTHIQAIDIDEWAYKNALENIQMNNCKNIQINIGGAEKIQTKFDIILANINRNILLKDMPNYVSALKPNGSLFLSGFFLEDFEIIKQSASSFGIINIQHHTHDNWVTAQFLKQ